MTVTTFETLFCFESLAVNTTWFRPGARGTVAIQTAEPVDLPLDLPAVQVTRTGPVPPEAVPENTSRSEVTGVSGTDTVMDRGAGVGSG